MAVQNSQRLSLFDLQKMPRFRILLSRSVPAMLRALNLIDFPDDAILCNQPTLTARAERAERAEGEQKTSRNHVYLNKEGASQRIISQIFHSLARPDVSNKGLGRTTKLSRLAVSDSLCKSFFFHSKEGMFSAYRFFCTNASLQHVRVATRSICVSADYSKIKNKNEYLEITR